MIQSPMIAWEGNYVVFLNMIKRWIYAGRRKIAFIVSEPKYFAVVLLAITIALPFMAHKGERPPVGDCNYTYTKIGEHILKIPTGHIYGIFLGNQSLRRRCGTSFQDPVIVDEVSFRAKINLPHDKGSYYVQYFVKHRSENVVVSLVQAALQAQSKDFSDLPEEDGFYKYIDETRGHSIYYFAKLPFLLGYGGSPLTISLANVNVTRIRSSTGFLWKSDVLFTTRPNDMDDKFPQTDSIGIWAEAFPVYLKIVEDMYVEGPEE